MNTHLWLAFAAAAVAGSSATTPMCAQTARADSLLNAGALQRAESMYYGAAQARPHDPAARLALGRYLVSRSAPRVGMTLLEEALQFGGNAPAINADLAPVYLSLGEYHKLSALKASPLSAGERTRAQWLVSRSTKLLAPDSTATVTYRKPSDAAALGRITVRVNGRPVEATISTHEHGIVVSDAAPIAKHLHAFASSGGGRASATGVVPAVADSIGFGQLSLADYPVAIHALPNGQQATIGLDVVARFAPTFDPANERLTLHVGGTVAKAAPGADELPTLVTRDDFRVLRAGGWVSIDQQPIQRMLTGRRWTVDARRGQLTIER
jgi:hypothetical protein